MPQYDKEPIFMSTSGSVWVTAQNDSEAALLHSTIDA